MRNDPICDMRMYSFNLKRDRFMIADPDFSFASPYARTTRRLDNAVVRMVLRGGRSYAEVAEELEGKMSRQAVGQLFHRRVKELNADQSEDSTWYRIILEEGPSLVYRGVLSRGRRLS